MAAEARASIGGDGYLDRKMVARLLGQEKGVVKRLVGAGFLTEYATPSEQGFKKVGFSRIEVEEFKAKYAFTAEVEERLGRRSKGESRRLLAVAEFERVSKVDAVDTLFLRSEVDRIEQLESPSCASTFDFGDR